MAYIKVDHSEFAKAATAIDKYVSLMNRKMNSANSEVNTLGATWQGTDYTNFKNQWNKVTNGDSTYRQMIKSLENYADFLRYAEGKYKTAQSNAVNRANDLNRWW